jgi:glutamyl-tRNA synthetase
MSIRLRFAPSPTGYLHIGGARTALFSWLFAKKHGGQFILRIEDTDEKRSIEGAVENIMDSLRWLGLDWDEGPDVGGDFGPYVQTERAEIYQKWAHWLVEQGHAYKCFATAVELDQMRQEQLARGETPQYDRRYRDLPAEKIAEYEAEGREYVIRHKMPLTGQTIVPDLIRGDIVFENAQLTDYVLLKSTGLPTYHLAHVVDDYLMQISHVTRGDEWINTAPVHVQLWQAFGWPMPVYAHMPVILNPSGKGKLSKRTQSFQDENQLVLVRVEEFREAGYLPTAVVNFLSNVGWAYGEDREIFSVSESLTRFDLKDVSPSPTKLPYSKLDWLNGQYIQELTPDELVAEITPFLLAEGWPVDEAVLHLVAPPIGVRLKRLAEAVDWLQFLYDQPPLVVPIEKVTHKQLPPEAAMAGFTQAREAVLDEAVPYTLESLTAVLTQIGETVSTSGKAGPFLGTLRFVVTGEAISPPLFESMLALGRTRVAERLTQALAILQGG